MEKYNIWMQSVEAAENNLTNSLESLYATLMNGDVIKGFYNNMAGFVDLFTEGTQAMGGMNLILPI